jgi:hypothetical protein
MNLVTPREPAGALQYKAGVELTSGPHRPLRRFLRGFIHFFFLPPLPRAKAQLRG